ncbi:MAG TPA: LysM peptidoglycan-binding domain-containing protein [bacterium]
MKRLILILFLVFLSVAQETTHTVKPDDTLWDIAGFYYQNPFLWPYIWRANLTKIEDPHWIYPDQVFVIPPSPEESVSVVPAMAPTEEYVSVAMPPTVTKPAAEVISVVEAEQRIWSEPMIHRAGLIIREDLPYWGKIVGTEPQGDKIIVTFDKIYIDRAADVKAGDMLTVYRYGAGLSSPKTGEYLGKEIIVLGKVEVAEVGEEGSRCKTVASYDIIKNGDFVTPYEPLLAPQNVTLVATTKELDAYVVAVKAFSEITPPHVLVYIDQGEEAEVAVGDMFDLYQERNVGGKKQPDYTIGKIQIVSVFEKASIGLLLNELDVLKIKRGERCRLTMESR